MIKKSKTEKLKSEKQNSNNDMYFCQRQIQIVVDTSSEKRTNGFCQRQMNIVVDIFCI